MAKVFNIKGEGRMAKILDIKGERRMAKVFNINGACSPRRHYMVDITQRLKSIKKMIDNGDYFTINRARQYGKTTILRALAEYLEKDYMVFSVRQTCGFYRR